MDEVEKIIEDIRALRIQGARNVALAALKAVRLVVLSSAEENLEEQVRSVVVRLARTRPTEPAMRDALTYVLRVLKSSPSKEEILSAIDRYEEEVREAENKIAEYGARKIPDGGTIITHCHSSTVIRVLSCAREMGKEFSVIVTETRPLYQGKITARELLENGIRVVYVVDSAAFYFMKDVDLYITGADAITSDGYVVNKIGTALIAAAAQRFDVPYYVAASTLKYDPVTAAGFPEIIEERDPSEIIDPSEIPGAEIRNPAFDVTPPDLIDGIISEIGIYSPQVFPMIVVQKKSVSDLEEEIALFRLAGLREKL